MQEHNYQQLYYTFFIFVVVRNKYYIPSFFRTTLSPIHWVLYQSGTYFITNGDFLTECLVLRWSGSLNISGSYITVPVLIVIVLLSTNLI